MLQSRVPKEGCVISLLVQPFVVVLGSFWILSSRAAFAEGGSEDAQGAGAAPAGAKAESVGALQPGGGSREILVWLLSIWGELPDGDGFIIAVR